MQLRDAVRFVDHIISSHLARAASLLVALLIGTTILVASADAQPVRAGETFYLKFGAGLSDYAGDASGPDFGSNRGPNTPEPITGIGDLFDTNKFTEGGPFPYTLSGEVGYQFSPEFGVGLGYQFGQYPFVHGRPFTVQNDLPGTGGDLGTVRHTVQLLGRYMLKAETWTFSPYIDTGLNATFGGHTTALGPFGGLGVDVSVGDRTSLFLETRLNLTLGDESIDGIDNGGEPDLLSALPAVGLRYTFKKPAVSPRILALNGPAEVEVDESTPFTARTNDAEATRPLSYQWDFGDGRSGAGLTASHTYDQPGEYIVTFTARNEAGTARDSLAVEVVSPARILSVDATPNPVKEGDPVRFQSEVTGAAPVTQEWEFGDGTTGSGVAPSHTYEEPGEYTVRLVASNEDGEDSAALTMQVNRARPAVCETVREFNSVYFDQGSSQITSAATEKLQENTDVLLKCPNLSVRTEGFAAPGEPNPQALSESRAQAVADFYENEGVDPSRVQSRGEGVVEGASGKKGDAQQSRRVDTILIDDGTEDASPNN